MQKTDFRMLNLKWEISITTLPSRFRIYAERLQDPEVANNLKKIGFSKTCIRSTEIKPSMKKGGRHEAHP